MYKTFLAVALIAFAMTSPARVAAAPVPLANPTAIRSQLGPFLPVTELIDGSINTNNGWGNDVGGNNTAVFETVTDLFPSSPFAVGGKLTFVIHSGGFSQHEIGRFRLSVTTADRSTFADGLINGGDVTTSWVVLTPLTFVSDNGGTTLTLLGDQSLLASGTPSAVPDFEKYTITADTLLADITGFRIEAISDPSLANQPGRAPNGNFVMQEFIVTAEPLPVPEPSTFALLALGALGLAIKARRRRIAA